MKLFHIEHLVYIWERESLYVLSQSHKEQLFIYYLFILFIYYRAKKIKYRENTTLPLSYILDPT